jgi:hypothetical protein
VFARVPRRPLGKSINYPLPTGELWLCRRSHRIAVQQKVERSNVSSDVTIVAKPGYESVDAVVLLVSQLPVDLRWQIGIEILRASTVLGPRWELLSPVASEKEPKSIGTQRLRRGADG